MLAELCGFCISISKFVKRKLVLKWDFNFWPSESVLQRMEAKPIQRRAQCLFHVDCLTHYRITSPHSTVLSIVLVP